MIMVAYFSSSAAVHGRRYSAYRKPFPVPAGSESGLPAGPAAAAAWLHRSGKSWRQSSCSTCPRTATWHGGDNWGAQWQQNFEEVDHLRCARRSLPLPACHRECHVVGPGNNHVPHAEGAGDQDCPHGVQHSQIADEQVGGNQAAAKEHGDDKQRVEQAFAFEIRTGHGIGCQQRHRYRDDCESTE